MRVICASMEEFLVDVKTQIDSNDGPECVFQQAIRLSVRSTAVDPDGVKVDIGICLSVMMGTTENPSQVLMECGVHCGRDYHDSSQDFEGSDKAAEMKEMVEVVAKKMGLTVRPGVISD